MFRAYLRKFPQGIYADLAQINLKKLEPAVETVIEQPVAEEETEGASTIVEVVSASFGVSTGETCAVTNIYGAIKTGEWVFVTDNEFYCRVREEPKATEESVIEQPVAEEETEGASTIVEVVSASFGVSTGETCAVTNIYGAIKTGEWVFVTDNEFYCRVREEPETGPEEPVAEEPQKAETTVKTEEKEAGCPVGTKQTYKGCVELSKAEADAAKAQAKAEARAKADAMAALAKAQAKTKTAGTDTESGEGTAACEAASQAEWAAFDAWSDALMSDDNEPEAWDAYKAAEDAMEAACN